MIPPSPSRLRLRDIVASIAGHTPSRGFLWPSESNSVPQSIADELRQIVHEELAPLAEYVQEIKDALGRLEPDLGLRSLARTPAHEPAQVVGKQVGDEEQRQEVERLKAAYSSAVMANEERTARIAHELRSPLGTIINVATLLSAEGMNSAQLDKVMQVISAANHTLRLVTYLLDAARSEAAETTVEPVDIAAVFDSARSLLHPIARAADVRVNDLDVGSGGRVPVVSANRRRVEQILLNLLSNAIRYNHRGGEVSVRAEPSGDALLISVTDTGAGISSEDLPRLFEPFARLGAEGSGPGIGLAVSRALSEQMGGRLSAQSTLGVGSTFTLELPLMPLSGIPSPATSS
jgi:signal transduction histidine kinase